MLLRYMFIFVPSTRKKDFCQVIERNGRHEETRTPDLCRVNFEVDDLKPFPHLAFPHSKGPKTPRKLPSFDGELRASVSDPAGSMSATAIFRQQPKVWRILQIVLNFGDFATPGGVQWATATAGTHHETRQLSIALPAAGSGPSHGTQYPGMGRQVFPSGDAARTKDRQGRHGAETGGSDVLDVAQRMGLRTVDEVWFARGTARKLPLSFLRRLSFRLAQSDIDSKHWAPDIYAIVRSLR